MGREEAKRKVDRRGRMKGRVWGRKEDTSIGKKEGEKTEKKEGKIVNGRTEDEKKEDDDMEKEKLG